MRPISFTVFIFVLLALAACQKDDLSEDKIYRKEKISGYIQKGPFIFKNRSLYTKNRENGSLIFITIFYEIDILFLLPKIHSLPFRALS